ncbi:interleukin-1 receptor-like 1 [Fundulus diaphanus]
MSSVKFLTMLLKMVLLLLFFTFISGEPLPNLGIYSPMNGEVFEVELGTAAVITCTAVIDSCGSSLFWLRKNEFVERNDTLRYFYNFTNPCNISEETSHWMNASLVFREVLEEDLSTNFTCKLESDEFTRFATITLNKTAGLSYSIITVCTVCIMGVMAVTIFIFVKFIGLKGCQRNTSVGCSLLDSGYYFLCLDGKIYDAFLMNYKSVNDGGLSEEDRKCLVSTLENQFGYSLCLYAQDVLPGQAVAEAVLDCIDESRAVILVPSFPDPELGSEVLSAIHASLVEKKTRLIFINTEQMEASTSGSFPEALQLLSKAGNSVTWKGGPPSSSFWKQLRYHLLAPLQAPKMQLLSQQC